MVRPVVVMLFLIMTSCAAFWPWGSRGSSSYNFSITYPEEWKRLNTKRYFMLTKDDPFKQYIMVRQRHVDKPFKHTDKLIRKGMSPQEAADVILDEVNADDSILGFKVIENVSATVHRYNGFKIVCTYGTKKGNKYKAIFYGFLIGEWLYGLRYNAGEGYYSEKDVETFQHVLNSFQITGSASR